MGGWGIGVFLPLCLLTVDKCLQDADDLVQGAKVLLAEDAKSKDLTVLTKALIKGTKPGNPAFEYYNAH